MGFTLDFNRYCMEWLYMIHRQVEVVAGSVHTTLDITSIQASGIYLVQLQTE